MNNRVTFLKPDDITKRVNSYVPQFEIVNALPIDVERLIEKNGISLVVVPDMRSIDGLESYITTDGVDKIYIDQYQYDKDVVRARFTIAHELGHLVLHKELLKSQNITNETKYFEFRKNITTDEEKRLEIQAYIFAGYILMPQKTFNSEVNKIVERFGGKGKIAVYELRHIIEHISKTFQCSNQSAMKQLKYEFDWMKEIFDAI